VSAASVSRELARPRLDRRRLAQRHGWTIGIYVLLAVLLAVEVAVAPVFSSFDLQSLVIATLPLAFAACAQAVIVISGGIDLSLGTQMALVNAISASLMEGRGLGSALLVSLGLMVLGVLVGTLTGLLVVVTGVADIVVTLAMSFVWAGVALTVMPQPGGGAPSGFTGLAQSGFLTDWVPQGLVVLAVVLAVVWVPLRSRRPGYAVYAVGSNRNAAFLSGVRVARTRVLAYAIGGFFAALGGLALTATTGIGSALSGEFYTLNSVAAIVLGGVSLAGGRGGLIGPVAAAFVISVLVAIMTFLGIDPNYAQVLQGTLVVVVVMIGGLVLLRRRA
jgi:ribose transport system permease protein